MGALLQNPTAGRAGIRSLAFARRRRRRERKAAFERFARAGLPSRRVEAWHYTDLRAKLRAAPPLAREARTPRRWRTRREKLRAGRTGLRIVTVDGFFSRRIVG